MARPLIMVVTDDMQMHFAFASALGECGLAPIVANTADEAMAILTHHPISLIFCSDELPDDQLDVLIRQDGRYRGNVPVVVISRLDDWDRYLDFLHYGAFDYVLYPVNRTEVERAVRNVTSLLTPKEYKPSRQFGSRPRSAYALPEFP